MWAMKHSLLSSKTNKWKENLFAEHNVLLRINAAQIAADIIAIVVCSSLCNLS